MAKTFVDNVLNSFRAEQAHLAEKLNARSDIARVVPLHGDREYLITLNCVGLVKRGGEIVRGGPFLLAARFGDDYLRAVHHPGEVLAWLLPDDVFNPNIGRGANPGGPIGICAGRIAPGTSIVDLTMQAWEIVTWNKVTIREDNALCREACQWARQNPDAYPVDTRPLYRRSARVEPLDPGRGGAAS